MRSREYFQLLTTSQARIYGYILSLVLNSDQANDILQQTNMVLWEKESEFELGTNFIAWAFRIAHFQVLAYRKKQDRDRLVFDDELIGDLAESKSQFDETFEMRQRLLQSCIEKLNSRQRDIVQRCYRDGQRLQVIAEETNFNVNVIKQLLFRARTALINCVKARSAPDSL